MFAGGWTLEAAEAVCDARQDLGLDVFEGISSLVDKSLVRPADTSSTEARFAMLATIREYGTERLTAAAEFDSCRQAHAAYCLILAEEGNTSDAAEQIRWLEMCDREHANLLAAIEFLIGSRQKEWALRLCSALLPFWQGRARFAEATDRLTRALRLADGAPPTDARTRATFALGTLWATMGDMGTAIPIHENVLASVPGARRPTGHGRRTQRDRHLLPLVAASGRTPRRHSRKPCRFFAGLATSKRWRGP